MSHPQATPNSDIKAVVSESQPSDQIILAQGMSLSTFNPNALSPSPWVVDYCPVDNHRALVNRWRDLQPTQQLMLGGCLGLALGWGFITWITALQRVIPFVPSGLRQPSALAPSGLTLLRQRLGESRATVNAGAPPETAAAVSAVRPSLRPIMVDRYYLPLQAVFPQQEAHAQAAIVVDRFYFDPSAVAGAEGAMSPEHQDAQLLAVPLPPPSPQTLAIAQGNAPPDGRPTPPTRSPASPVPSQTVAVATQVPKPNRLLGVIQTGQFSAALIQTGGNSYAVRLGDRVSQSAWQLVEVQANAVIVSDGQERHLLHVGDMF
ncbi:hypothetical protein GFS31_00300 [Leptolyngbya sp. BL0902]|uniref:hypothetical protein n=1 Tax=Leptolyngbya sp. BL0902 TaxID=1115757 RepID=UPI0018E8DE43|nr:hypothetical protein [Leptolyngbya sp. BL0902]QQE63366.1 hypothetical protein GFS31_00300 [Leptolyngbya sp. BL0902]